MTPEQTDFCAGIALLYMNPNQPDDEYTRRMATAMQTDDVQEAEHVCALMITVMYGRGPATQELRDLSTTWKRLFG